MTTVTVLDTVCKNIGRLPLELRHAIFNCLTVDFRLEMLQEKKAQIIRTLYEAYTERLLDITKLKEIVDRVIRLHFFYRKLLTDTNYRIQPPLKKLLPLLEFKQMGETISTEHPVFKALREIVFIPKIYGTIRTTYLNTHAHDSLNKIVSTITNTWDIVPTLTVPSGCIHSNKHDINCGDKFNYRIRKYTFNSICILAKFVSKFKVPLEEKAIQKLKTTHMRYLKKSIIPQIRGVGYRKMQSKLKLSAKKVAKEAKEVAKKVAKEAKEAAKKKAKEAKEAAKKKAKEAKEARKKKVKM